MSDRYPFLFYLPKLPSRHDPAAEISTRDTLAVDTTNGLALWACVSTALEALIVMRSHAMRPLMQFLDSKVCKSAGLWVPARLGGEKLFELWECGLVAADELGFADFSGLTAQTGTGRFRTRRDPAPGAGRRRRAASGGQAGQAAWLRMARAETWPRHGR